jgi:hypothetical protein
MNDASKSFWPKFWAQPYRLFLLLMLVSALALFVFCTLLSLGENWANPWLLRLFAGSALLFWLACLGLVLSSIPKTRFLAAWILRRWLFCAAVIVTLIALFYAEEDWRGKRAWEQCKRDSQAKGIELDWSKFIPPAVSDEQNIYKAPKMSEWFVRSGGRPASSDFDKQLSSNKLTRTNITNAIEARNYLEWSRQFDPQFDLIRDALKRPYARIDTDYASPSTMDIPAIPMVRSVVRVLAQRAKCELVVGEPEAALQDQTLIHDLIHLLEAKPVTLVAAMINVINSGLYLDSVGAGLQTKAWREPQLVELEKQLADMNLMPQMDQAFRGEQVFSSGILETPRAQLIRTFGAVFPTQPKNSTWFEHLQNPEVWMIALSPRGWLYQNSTVRTRISQKFLESVDPRNEIVRPGPQSEMTQAMVTAFEHISPYNILAARLTPNFSKAFQVMARNQTFVNEALVACALERYRIAHGEYPESLDVLAPQFIEKVPHDIINDGALKYRRSNDCFVLYSVGWNEKDDGGIATLNKDGSQSTDTGDWVWKF